MPMIQPFYGTLQNLFEDRVFRIPHYQRFYSWTKKQREDLFADLKKLADREDDNHHFMATIVCHKTPDVRAVGIRQYRLYDVVDGQQRLTTLILILKCLELSLGENTDDRAEVRRILVKQDGNLILLQTNNSNEYIFNRFLREGESPANDVIVTQADKNLRNAIRQCNEFVAQWREERGNLLSLLQLVYYRLGFVIFDTEDDRVVYSIFEVLNSRGLAVDWLDKCKSVLMERAFELAPNEEARTTNIGTLQRLWERIYKEIAAVSLRGEEVLRVTATLKHGPSRGKPQAAEDAMDALRNDCDQAQQPQQVTEKILDVTQKLVKLSQNTFLGPVTKVLHARILAVALMSAEQLSNIEKERCLRQWERVSFRIFEFAGKDSRTKVGEYLRLANKIINRAEGASRYSEVMASLRELGEGYPVQDVVTSGLNNTNAYENPDMVRYLLWKYEEHLATEAGQNATTNPHARADIWDLRSQDSIEHIFPQNPEPGGAWDGKMTDENAETYEHEAHVNRIGNLVLLPQPLNEEAKRQGFAAKCEVYKRHQLRMVADVRVQCDWTIQQINEREKTLIAWAEQEWGDLQD